MTEDRIDRKLEQFEQAIMAKAEEERRGILQAAEEQRRAELEREENRLLEELYRKIQTDIARIRTENVKEISRETLEVKRALYRRRETCLTELVEQARERLAAFSAGPDYAGWLTARAGAAAESYETAGGTVYLRPADRGLAARVGEACGGCPVDEDPEILIGGLRLENPARNISVDLTLDTALEQQREWFFRGSRFTLQSDAAADDGGEPACNS